MTNSRGRRKNSNAWELQPSEQENKTKKAKTTNISSYKVFLKFVQYKNGDSEADASNVFSTECFDYWLATRPNGKIKHPPQSFQRVLYAHIRGADKRVPFPKEVEASLLKLLRDKEKNPWSQVFKNVPGIIGKRGFKRNGFHEERLLEKNCATSDSIETSSTPMASSESDFKASDVDSVEQALEPETNSFFKRTLAEASKTSTVPWDKVINALQEYIPLEVRKASMLAANKRKLEIWSPAMYFYLNQMIDPNDLRFSPKFQFPPVQEQQFRSDRSVACFEVGFDHTIIREDPNALELFRGSCLTKHVCELHVSRVAFCYALIEHMKEVSEKGFVWRRDLLQRVDGSRIVALAKAVKGESDHMLYIQNQTDLYPALLNKFCLI